MRFKFISFLVITFISCNSGFPPEASTAIEKAQKEIFFEIQRGSQVGKLTIEGVEKEVELLNDTLLIIDYSFKLGVEGYPTPFDFYDISLVRFGKGKFTRVRLLESEDQESFELYAPKIHEHYKNIVSGEELKNAKDLNDLENFKLSLVGLDSNRYLKVIVKGHVDDASFDKYGLFNSSNNLYIRTNNEPNKLVICELNPLFKNIDSLLSGIHQKNEISIVGLIDENEDYGITRLTDCILVRRD